MGDDFQIESSQGSKLNQSSQTSQQTKVQYHVVPQVNSTEPLKESINILLKLFQKAEEGGKLPDSFFEASITLRPNTDPHKEREL